MKSRDRHVQEAFKLRQTLRAYARWTSGETKASIIRILHVLEYHRKAEIYPLSDEAVPDYLYIVRECENLRESQPKLYQELMDANVLRAARTADAPVPLKKRPVRHHGMTHAQWMATADARLKEFVARLDAGQVGDYATDLDVGDDVTDLLSWWHETDGKPPSAA